MNSKYELFDISRVRTRRLAERQHDLDLSCLIETRPVPVTYPELMDTATGILRARERGAAVILLMGAHVIRSGVQRHLIDLMRRGLVSCLAMNGAGPIHDFELALIGATTESVARYIRDGRFGLWEETGRINAIIGAAAREGLGLGEAIGRTILEGDFPHKDISLLAQAYAMDIPVTVHVGIGQDIIHEHPNFDPAATGACSGRDFLIFAKVMERLGGGVLMNFGTAVMGPEVALKALAITRNVLASDGRHLGAFDTLVCDLRRLPDNISAPPPHGEPDYFFRPWKSLLVRTLEGGGLSRYVCAPHRETIPQLWTAIAQAKKGAL